MNGYYNLGGTLVLLCMSLFSSASAEEGAWPQLDDASGNPVCQQAFAIADGAFRSDSVNLYESVKLPEAFASTLVFPLTPPQGSLLDSAADPDVFDTLPLGDRRNLDFVHWQKRPIKGLRLAMLEGPVGWRGDSYELLAVPETISVETFIAEHADLERQHAVSVIADGWHPPRILRGNEDGALWVIDIAPWTFLGNWTVYTVAADGAKPRCTIRFRPETDTATALLPAAVRRLATLVDGTLGGGEDEGTMHPTASIRGTVAHTWANVAARPWVVKQQQFTPYNDRTQVDAELKAWSKKAPSFGALYRRINAQYPRAQSALAAYYRKEFGKTAEEADAMAETLLDIAFRSYFVFHKPG